MSEPREAPQSDGGPVGTEPLARYPALHHDALSTEASTHLPIGDRTLLALSDGFFRPGVMATHREFVGSPSDPTAGWDSLHAEHGDVRMPIGCFLLPGEVNTLIDLGVGPIDYLDGLLVGGNLLRQMAREGFQPSDIDLIALSHLHTDHVGWICDGEGNPTFPNARVVIGAADWAYFVEAESPAARMREVIRHALLVLAERDQVVLVDGDEVIAKGVTRLDAPGHTPGHSLFGISDGGERALLFGDAIYCPGQFTHTDWDTAFDVDKDLARATRERYLRQLENEGSIGMSCHIPGLQAGRILSGAWRDYP